MQLWLGMAWPAPINNTCKLICLYDFIYSTMSDGGGPTVRKGNACEMGTARRSQRLRGQDKLFVFWPLTLCLYLVGSML